MSKEEMLELFGETSSPYYYDEENRLRRNMTHAELQECGLHPRFIKMNTQLNPEVIKFLKDWLNQWTRIKRPSQSFYIHGPLEDAETLFSLFLRGVANRCGIFHAVSALEFGEQCREHKREEFYSTVACLGIYNFGMQYRDKEGYWDHFFTNVLFRRYDRGLPTVVVSHYTMDQIQAMYNPQNSSGNTNAIYASVNFIEALNRILKEITLT